MSQPLSTLSAWKGASSPSGLLFRLEPFPFEKDWLASSALWLPPPPSSCASTDNLNESDFARAMADCARASTSSRPRSSSSIFVTLYLTVPCDRSGRLQKQPRLVLVHFRFRETYEQSYATAFEVRQPGRNNTPLASALLKPLPSTGQSIYSIF